ncbi:vacuolar protein sorting-associated protein 37B [Aplysia californica]|uniref:Vacuolar protein sorting-associated protein 37B n=1 Tax=Aplysia californica TaxID=6500 RepID=A0ABM0K7V3_APLCA|nr:vacuolar protein sorting-associated protein 37B [Aplysia californica]XP_005110859.1 vacuolar protein sorting-associated protein 37B [Aplysia californica]XP_005110861.1 vacuolar protein sorting-associated protein 37B [Aplysia californica]
MYQSYGRGSGYAGSGSLFDASPTNHYAMPSGQSLSHSHHGLSSAYSASAASSSRSGGMSSSSSSSALSAQSESSALSLLQHLDKNELQHLLENDSKLQDLVDDLPQVKSMQVEHDNLIATNKSLAEYNLSLQPRIEDLKQYVAGEYEKVNALKTDLASHKATLDTYVGRQSLDTLHALLQTETAKSEEESEELADKFCSKDVDAEDFMTEYLPKRTVAHLRRIKSERLAELIRNTGPGGASPGYGASRGAGAGSGGGNNSWGMSSSVHGHHQAPYPDAGGPGGAVPPYPTSGFGMPQPNMYSGH